MLEGVFETLWSSGIASLLAADVGNGMAKRDATSSVPCEESVEECGGKEGAAEVQGTVLGG